MVYAYKRLKEHPLSPKRVFGATTNGSPTSRPPRTSTASSSTPTSLLPLRPSLGPGQRLGRLFGRLPPKYVRLQTEPSSGSKLRPGTSWSLAWANFVMQFSRLQSSSSLVACRVTTQRVSFAAIIPLPTRSSFFDFLPLGPYLVGVRHVPRLRLHGVRPIRVLLGLLFAFAGAKG